MADENTNAPDDFKDVADKSTEAGIADESAAYEKAISKSDDTRDAPPSIDEGDPKTTDDGSGTSETD